MLRQTTSLALNHRNSSRFRPAAGSLYTFNYARGEYWNGTTRSTLAATHTTTRASVAEAINFAGDGLHPQAGNNVTRIDSRGALIEASSTNLVRNNTMAGAVAGVVGSGGSLPTNWSIFAASGLVTTVIGTGTENGVAYVELDLTGTSSATFYVLAFESPTQNVGASGEVYTASLLASRTGGSMTNIVALNTEVRQSGGAAPSFDAAFNSLTSSLAKQPASTATLVVGATFVNAAFYLNMTSGVAVSIRLRLAIPQLEKLAYATSPILTSGAAATRAAEGFTATSVAPGSDFTIAGVARVNPITIAGAHLLNIGPDNNNVLRIRRANGDPSIFLFESIVAGVATGNAQTAAGVLVNGQRFGFACRRVGTSMSLSINGAAVITSVVASQPGAPVSMSVGQQNPGINAWGDRIEQIVAFGSGVNDATLQSYAILGTLP